MKEKKRRGSTNLSDRSPLTKSRKQFSLRKPNRIRKKSQEKLNPDEIQMNPHFTFYFDENGVCCYRLKRKYRNE